MSTKRNTTLTLPGRSTGLLVSADQLEALAGPEVRVAAEMQQNSLKNRILRAVAEHGPLEDVPALTQYIRPERGEQDRGRGFHEVTHLLWSLNKQGMVVFKEAKGNIPGGATSNLLRIECTDRGYTKAGFPAKPPISPENPQGGRPPGWSRQRHAVGKDYTEQRYHGTEAKGDEVIRMQSAPAPVVQLPPPQTDAVDEPTPVDPPAPSTPAPASPSRPVQQLAEYPELARLRQRQAEKERLTTKASAYVKAAEAIIDVDEAEATRLLAMATAMEGEQFTAVELELLDLAEHLDWEDSH